LTNIFIKYKKNIFGTEKEEKMDEKYCSFKERGCPIFSSFSRVCLKGDEKICTMTMIIKEKQEKIKIKEVDKMAANGKLQKHCKCGAVLTSMGWTKSILIITEKELPKILSLPKGVCEECLEKAR
jgi:hypothetical protein